MTIDVSKLALKCGFNDKTLFREYPPNGVVFECTPEQLTAYTRAVMEECAKACETQKYMVLDPLRTYSADDLCKAQKSAATHLAAAIREMMP